MSKDYINKETMILRMSPWDFDQSPNGWRKIDSKRNHIKAANLIRKYIAKNKARILSSPNARKKIDMEIMYFHIGQLLASAGKIHWPAAIKAFRKASRKADPFWNAHVSATIGFLEGSERKINNAIRFIESSRKKYKSSGNLKIIKNFKIGLEMGIRDYEKVVLSLPKKLVSS